MIIPKEITFSGLSQEIVTIIVQSTRNEKAKLHGCKLYLDDENTMTLQDIEDKAKKDFKNLSLITVLVSRPLSGEVYEYGNYGDYWVKTGDLIGYA